MSVVLPDNIIPIAQATTRLTLFDTATEAAAGLIGKFLEIERIHRASQANVEVGDLAF